MAHIHVHEPGYMSTLLASWMVKCILIHIQSALKYSQWRVATTSAATIQSLKQLIAQLGIQETIV